MPESRRSVGRLPGGQGRGAGLAERQLGSGPDRAGLVGPARRVGVGLPHLAGGMVRPGAVRRRRPRAVRSAFAEVGALPPPTGLGQLLGGPMLLIHGSEEQKARFLPALVRGEELWCQFFSEPGSGSDLASAQTRAVREGGRLDRQRPEGLDLRGPVRRPRDAAGPDRPGGAQAPGPELLHHRRRPARHRGQAAAPDERPARLQRGVLHRRAHRRGPAGRRGGQRLVGRGDRADVRAFLDGPAVGHARVARRATWTSWRGAAAARVAQAPPTGRTGVSELVIDVATGARRGQRPGDAAAAGARCGRRRRRTAT